MGAAVTMAIVAAWRKSAVSKPVKVAPTIVPLARSTTRREGPPVSLPWKLAPGGPSGRGGPPVFLPWEAGAGGAVGGGVARAGVDPRRLRLCERFAGGGDLRVGE